MYASISLKRRVLTLEASVRLTEIISSQMRYLSAPIHEIVHRLAANEELSALPFLDEINSLINSGAKPHEAWEQSVAKSDCGLSLSDKELLADFGRELGKSDVESQLAHCEVFREKLSSRAEDAKSDYTGKGNLYTTIGVVCGLGIATLLI